MAPFNVRHGWPGARHEFEPPGAAYRAFTLVSRKLAKSTCPSAVANTVYGPMLVLAVSRGADARPLLSVVTKATFVPVSANVLLALEAGAVNVTVTPDAGFPDGSNTEAVRACSKGEPIVANCPDPLSASRRPS